MNLRNIKKLQISCHNCGKIGSIQFSETINITQ